MAIVPTLTQAQYEIERAICDRAQAYWKANATFNKGGWSSMSADLAANPEYAACDNDMRGRVEQFELLRDLPETLVAYIGEQTDSWRTSCPVTVWTGLQIGNATKGSEWRAGCGVRMAQYYARIGGREYTGRGQGVGMAVVFRETADSKRRRKLA